MRDDTRNVVFDPEGDHAGTYGKKDVAGRSRQTGMRHRRCHSEV